MSPGGFLCKAIFTPEIFHFSSVKMRTGVLIGKGDRIQHFAHCEKNVLRMSSLVPDKKIFFEALFSEARRAFFDEVGERFGGPEQPDGFS